MHDVIPPRGGFIAVTKDDENGTNPREAPWLPDYGPVDERLLYEMNCTTDLNDFGVQPSPTTHHSTHGH